MTLVDMAKENDKIVTVTAAMPSGTGLSRFQAVYPDRMIDVGIAEEHAVTMCAAWQRAVCGPILRCTHPSSNAAMIR